MCVCVCVCVYIFIRECFETRERGGGKGEEGRKEGRMRSGIERWRIPLQSARRRETAAKRKFPRAEFLGYVYIYIHTLHFIFRENEI